MSWIELVQYSSVVLADYNHQNNAYFGTFDNAVNFLFETA